MEVLVCKDAGFCPGIKKSVEVAIKASMVEGEVETLGPLIHNKEFVKSLEKKQIFERKSIEEIKTGKVIIRAHGIEKKLFDKIKKRGWKFYDAACVVVKSVYRVAIEDMKDGYFIFIFGNLEHPEIRGISSYLKNKYFVFNSIAEIEKFDKFQKISLISQTTENEEEFLKAANIIRQRGDDIIIHNTICPEVIKRKKSSIELAKNVDFMIVVGGKHSANTKKLFECVSKICPSLHIEKEDEISFEMIKNKQKIAITSGTSTPKEQVERVARYLKNLKFNKFFSKS